MLPFLSSRLIGDQINSMIVMLLGLFKFNFPNKPFFGVDNVKDTSTM
jgi:hypothetical protein